MQSRIIIFEGLLNRRSIHPGLCYSGKGIPISDIDLVLEMLKEWQANTWDELGSNCGFWLRYHPINISPQPQENDIYDSYLYGM